MIRIVVDERERSSDVPSHLQCMGMNVEFRMLDVGDYVIGNRVIERKTARDFMTSLFSGRLFDQARRLSEAYELPIMVVEGGIQEAIYGLSTPKVFWGALASLSLKFGVRIFYTADTLQTSDLISVFAKQTLFRERKLPLVVKKPRIETVADAQLSIVENLPGIGPKLADRLLRRFGTLRRIFTASPIELSITEKVGKAKARKITELLDAKYKPRERMPIQKRLA